MLDLVIIGGGIAGNALAAVMARAGRTVLVLERSTVYRDRVRGEMIQPWGVAEAMRLGVHDELLRAGGTHHTRFVPYDETEEPAVARAAAVPLDEVIPGVPGTMGVGHPSACRALAEAAEAGGGRVLRGVDTVDVSFGSAPTVRYRFDGGQHEVHCRLVVGADGRDSGVRRRAGIPLHAVDPRLLGAGLLVEELWDWPSHQITIGTEGDVVFFVLPQGSGRARLYLMYPVDQRRRFTGPTAAQAFLDSFRLACMPESECIGRAKPAGPCAAFPMNDTWTDAPIGEGLALVGDAAGYSDPQAGQGLSVALRDVRVLSEILLAGEDWSTLALRLYAEERGERMRRLRICTEVVLKLRGEFGPEPRERRRMARARMRAQPELGLWRRAMVAGPESVPATAFDKAVFDALFAGATIVA